MIDDLDRDLRSQLSRSRRRCWVALSAFAAESAWSGLMILPGEENRAVAPASIVVVENFGEELKRRVRPSER